MRRRAFTLAELLCAAALLTLFFFPFASAFARLLTAQTATVRALGELDELQSALATGRADGDVRLRGFGAELGKRTLGGKEGTEP